MEMGRLNFAFSYAIKETFYGIDLIWEFSCDHISND